MDAFGNLDPVHATLRDMAHEQGLVTPPPARPDIVSPVPESATTCSRDAAAAPQTPKRRSPRVEALRNAPPTPRQIERMEMEDAFTRRVQRRVSTGSAGQPAPAKVQRRVRECRSRASPHVSVAASKHADEDEADEVGDADDPDDDEDAPDDPEGNDDDEEDDARSVSSVATTTSCTVQVVPHRVAVPAPQYAHRDWAAWKANVKTYQAETSILWHNHLVGPDIYATYPIARGIKNDENATRANDMVADGMRRAAVYDMLLAKGENVFQVDIDNLYNSHQTRITLADDNEALAREVALFTAANDGGVVTVDQTDRGISGVISLTTQHMRNMCARFGELLLVDCTHKTNRYNYQLCTFMVMDEFGHGKVVQQSLLETNADWHMQRALLHLKRANEEAWKLVRVIMVDKDMNEIRVLEHGFPEARLLFCHFHVLKYLAKVITEPRFGKISVDDHKTLDMLLHRLVYAPTVLEFENEKLAFILTCERLDFMDFVEYMDTNWFGCTEMWAMFHRAKLPHLKNHTNNRLESYFGKFKQGVDENSSLTECFKALVSSARRSENEYEKSVKRQGSYVNENYDEEMSSVLLCSTPFVAKAVEPQYTAAINKFEEYVYVVDKAENIVTVKGLHHEHTVDLLDWSCDCVFAKSMRLPCRHAMAYRRQMGGRAVIPLKRIDNRWKRQTVDLPVVKRFTFNTAHRTPEGQRPTEKERGDKAKSRYNEALRIMQPICSELAEIEDEGEFEMYVEFLQAQYQNIRQRKRAHVARESQSASSGGGMSPPVADEMEMGSQTDGDQVGVDEDSDTGEATIDASQANSLFSSQVGDVPAPSLSDIRFAQRVDEGGLEHGQDLDQPGSDMEVDDAGGETTGTAGDVQGDPEPRGAQSMNAGQAIEFNINQKAPKTGRKPKNVRREVSDQRQERARFNASEKIRRQYGELTLLDVVNALDNEKPDVEETQRRLAGVTVKFKEHAGSRSKYQKLANPTLNQDSYYLLPPILLDACIKKFPLATGDSEPISVGTPDPHRPHRRSPRQASADPTAASPLVEVVSITKVGMFSRQQIETMRRVETLQTTCEEGERFYVWLGMDVAARVTATLQSTAKALAVQFKSMYPFAPVPTGASTITTP